MPVPSAYPAKSNHSIGRTVEEIRGQQQSLFATPEVRTTRVVTKTAVPSQIVIDLSSDEQSRLRQQMQQLRLICPLLRLHIVLLLAQHRSPTEIADWLLCSRSSVYEVAACWRQGWRPDQREPSAEDNSVLPLPPSLRRSLLALLQKPPMADGWCRTRWSCATLALSLEARRGLRVSAETMRRWLQRLGWRWKRAKLVAKDNDPQRATKLATIRLAAEMLQPRQALLFVDELDIALLPKTGYQWMPKGTQTEVLTPGKNEKQYLAGGWDFRTGVMHCCFGERKTNALFRNLLDTLQSRYPAQRYDQVYIVADNYCIHKTQAVQQWLVAHPRFQLLWLPTYCPRANPIERAFGDTHDKVTRNHKRKRLCDLVADVRRHLDRNGPWHYHLSQIYQEPEITMALKKLRQDKHAA
jgi:transposase